jgi:hypothetical protein
MLLEWQTISGVNSYDTTHNQGIRSGFKTRPIIALIMQKEVVD